MPESLWQPQHPDPPAVRVPGPPRPAHTDGRRTLDAAATTVLLVLLLPLALVAMFVGLLSGLGVSGCGTSGTCRSVLEAYVLVLLVAPPVLWVAAAAASVVLLLRRRPAWWVPLLATALWVVLAAGYLGAAEVLQP